MPVAISESKLKVFISYSRADEAFAQELVSGLRLCGFQPYFDQRDIAPGEEWEVRLGSLIEAADTVIFVISPESVASTRCTWEVARSEALHKRLLPVVWREVQPEQVPTGLRRLNYIFFNRALGFATALDGLAAALRTDLAWIRRHTQLGESALKWASNNRGDAFLLRGEELASAIAWLQAPPNFAPEANVLTHEFIKASEDAEAARANAERRRLEEIAAAQSAQALALLEREEAIKGQKRAIQQRALLRNIGAATLSLVAAVAVWQALEARQGRVRVEQEIENTSRKLRIVRDSAGPLIAMISDDDRKARNLSVAEQFHLALLEFFHTLSKHTPETVEWQRAIADENDNIGQVYLRQLRTRDASHRFEEALSIRKRIAERSSDWITHRDLAASHHNLGNVLRSNRFSNEALAMQEAARKHLEKAIQLAHGSPGVNDLRTRLTRIYTGLGEVYEDLGRNSDQRQVRLDALVIRNDIYQSDTTDQEAKRLLAWAHHWVGGDHGSAGQWPDALDSYLGSLRLRDELVKTNPANERANNELAWGHHNVGTALHALKRFAEAEQHLIKASSIQRRQIGTDTTNLLVRKDYAISLIGLGNLAKDQGKQQEAYEFYSRARNEAEEILGYSQISQSNRMTISDVYDQIGQMLRERGDKIAALANFEKRLDILLKHSKAIAEDASMLKQVANSHLLIAELRLELADPSSARRHLEESRMLLDKLSGKHPGNATTAELLERVNRVSVGLVRKERGQ